MAAPPAPQNRSRSSGLATALATARTCHRGVDSPFPACHTLGYIEKEAEMRTQRENDRSRYGFLRSVGASHDTAALKVARGNWNPYETTDPTPTPERVAEVETNVADLHR
jgi:hypothetical protein